MSEELHNLVLRDESSIRAEAQANQPKPKFATYKVSNPTQVDHVINTVDENGLHRHRNIPAGTVVDGVRIIETEAKEMENAAKDKSYRGLTIASSSGTGEVDKTKGPERVPPEEMVRAPRPGDEPSKDKNYDPARNPLPSQRPEVVAEHPPGRLRK